MRTKLNRIKSGVATFAIAAMIGGGLLAVNASADPATTNSSNSESRENDRVNVVGEHHYNSEAERANDAMLITEVKTALSHDGVANDYPLAVDCDHGKILL